MIGRGPLEEAVLTVSGHKENSRCARPHLVAPALLTRRGPPPTQRGK